MQNKYCIDIINTIEAVYPVDTACEWDNIGLLVGRSGKEVNRIYIALDATEEVINNAILHQADMLITHHPLILSPLKKITDENFISSRVVQLLQHDICYYAIHTNYDVLRMADLACEKMCLRNLEALEDMGIGRIGSLKEEISLESCCNMVKEQFALDEVKVYGKLLSQISRIGICPGSGKSVIQAALNKEVQVLITGDIGHHDGIDALARGLSIIDAGHYGIEHIFIEDLRGFLSNYYNELVIQTEPIKQPFQMV